MRRESLFESVPNFSEGRRAGVIEAIAAAGGGAHVLDVDSDPDHNRTVVSLAGYRQPLVDGLVAAVAEAARRIDLREHSGVHPRVGAADVVPIVPLGDTTLEECHAVAREVGARIWSELHLPVFFYGHGESRRLADVRAGRATPDLGGQKLDPAAGAVCVGARPPLIAFNVILYSTDMVAARSLAKSLREVSGGLRGVQSLAFALPGERFQLSMNLFRAEETGPAAVLAELERRGVSFGAPEVVGLCPAGAATPAADGRLLEGRLACAAARAAGAACRAMGDEEHERLAARLEREAGALAALAAGQDELLSGAERAAALVPVMRAAGLAEPELESMLGVAARGMRAALRDATEALYRARVEALDARLRPNPA